MSYPHPSHQIQEILEQKKCLPPGAPVELARCGKERKSAKFETRPQLIDGGFIDMRYLGSAPRLDQPETYEAAFLLANQRVRGVGYNPLARENLRYKRRIPKGWHQNVCDPNLPTNDVRQNVHHPLPGFAPTDFQDFVSQTAKMWNIDLGWDWEGGLFQ
jgi:hypothetical protein